MLEKNRVITNLTIFNSAWNTRKLDPKSNRTEIEKYIKK